MLAQPYDASVDDADLRRALSSLDWVLGVVVAAQLAVPPRGRPALRHLLARSPMSVKVEQVAALLPDDSLLVAALREAAGARHLSWGGRLGERAHDPGGRPDLAHAVSRAEQARAALLLVADALLARRPADDVHDLDWWSRAGRHLAEGGAVPASAALVRLVADL